MPIVFDNPSIPRSAGLPAFHAWRLLMQAHDDGLEQHPALCFALAQALAPRALVLTITQQEREEALQTFRDAWGQRVAEFGAPDLTAPLHIADALVYGFALPRHPHECQDCRFMGRYGNHDLYVHPDDGDPDDRHATPEGAGRALVVTPEGCEAFALPLPDGFAGLVSSARTALMRAQNLGLLLPE